MTGGDEKTEAEREGETEVLPVDEYIQHFKCHASAYSDSVMPSDLRSQQKLAYRLTYWERNSMNVIYQQVFFFSTLQTYVGLHPLTSVKHR